MAEVRIGEEAEAEFIEALAWYHARSARAAEGFEKAFAEAVERIGQSPDQFPPCDAGDDSSGRTLEFGENVESYTATATTWVSPRRSACRMGRMVIWISWPRSFKH